VRKEFTDEMFRLVKEQRIKTVILSTFWMQYSSDSVDAIYKGSFNLSSNVLEKQQIFTKSFVETVKFFQENGVDLWIIKDVPSYGFNVSHALAKQALYGDIDRISQTLTEHNQRLELMNRLLTETGQELRSIDPADVLCKSGTCITSQDGKSLYTDDNHLSPSGVWLLKDSLTPFFVATMAKKTAKSPAKMAMISQPTQTN
jgi:hypothetical protein